MNDRELMALGLFADFALLLIVLLVALRDQSRLDQLRTALARPNGFDFKKLGAPLDQIGESLHAALPRRRALDTTLAAAIKAIHQTPLLGPFWLIFVLDALFLLTALSPLTWALWDAGTTLREVAKTSVTLAPPRLYTDVLLSGRVDFAFLRIDQGFRSSAVLLGVLSLTWALRWYLLRPEVREAQMLGSLLRTVTVAEPGAVAPLSARYATALAPQSDLFPAIQTSFTFATLATLSFLALYVGAPMRSASNQEPTFFELFPPATTLPAGFSEIELPAVAAGQPLREPLPELLVSLDRVELMAPGGRRTKVLRLRRGRLPDEDWQGALRASPFALDEQPTFSVRVSIDRRVPLRTVYELLRELVAIESIPSFRLVLRRGPLPGSNETRPGELWLSVGAGGSRGWALSVDGPASTPTLVLMPPGSDAGRILGDPSEVRSHLASEPNSGKSTEFGIKVADLLEPSRDARDYGHLIEILGAADSLCPSKQDCGLPGTGLHFHLHP